MKLNIAIIGSGIGGLAAAIRLAVKGHDVSVFERSDRSGGMIQEKEWEGYRWDVGPCTLLMPDQAEELFLLAGEEMKVSVRTYHLDQVSKYFFGDGLVLNDFGDVDAFCKEIQQKTGEPGRRVHRYLDRQRKSYEKTSKVLMRFSITLREIFQLKGSLQALLLALRHDFMYTAHGANSRAFKSLHVVRLFDWLASSQGSNPYKAPSTSNLNAHFTHNLGVYYPEKGMSILTKELYQLASQLGVTFNFGENVEGIDLRHKTVKGIFTSKDYFKSDIVISDVDIHQVYKDLLPGNHKSKKYLNQELSSSAIIFYWAVDKAFPELCVQNILLSPNQEAEYASLSNGKIYNHPTIQLNISSKVASNDAPEGCENWVLIVNVPVNTGQDWDAEVKAVREEVVSRINKVLNTDIEKYIRQAYTSDPLSLENDFSSYRGSIFASNNNRKFSAFRRHPNFLSHIHGLYFVGRSVHPGGGIPMSLTSARNADLQIEKHYSLS